MRYLHGKIVIDEIYIPLFVYTSSTSYKHPKKYPTRKKEIIFFLSFFLSTSIGHVMLELPF